MIQEIRIEIEKSEWRIITVYSNLKMEQVRRLSGDIEEGEADYLLIGEDSIQV